MVGKWCLRCGKQPPAPGRRYCELCAEANRLYRARKAEVNPVGICSRCKVRSNDLGFRQCESCRAYVRMVLSRLRAREPEMVRARQRQFHATRRQRVIEHYGGKCVCCGEREEVFLELDHVDGGGDAHRREIGGGVKTVGWIIKNDYPPIFRVLCANCHRAITRTGACPHQ